MSFNATTFTVCGIPPYIFFVGIGAVAAFGLYNFLLIRLKADIKKANRAAVFSIPALLFGAKLFGVVANIVECVVYNKPINKDTFLYSGIVFYGGLIFFVFCFCLIIHKYPMELKVKILDSLAPSIPLFHLFGRIGCFTAGCCYGVPSKGAFGVTYTTWVKGITTTCYRIPIQLVESCFNLLLCIFLLCMVIKGCFKGKLVYIYILTYSCIRFVDEFFRGDINKEILHGFSAAQLISVILFVVAFIILFKERKEKYVQSRREC